MAGSNVGIMTETGSGRVACSFCGRTVALVQRIVQGPSGHMVARVPSRQTGTDLPPKPPMRSMPRTNEASSWVLIRSTSRGSGPWSRKRAISSSRTRSTSARSPPGWAVAWIMKTLAISRGRVNAPTSVAICSS